MRLIKDLFVEFFHHVCARLLQVHSLLKLRQLLVKLDVEFGGLLRENAGQLPLSVLGELAERLLLLYRDGWL